MSPLYYVVSLGLAVAYLANGCKDFDLMMLSLLFNLVGRCADIETKLAAKA